MNNSINNCCICSQIVGDKKNDLISILLNEKEYRRRIAIENEYFVVIPSLGALVPGHSLICPKSHFKSIAQLDSKLDNYYLEILEETISILKREYNTAVHCFEHGAAKNDTKIICTVDHAHLHLLPTNISIEKILFGKYNWIEIGKSLEEFRTVVGEKEYIYYESPDKRKFIANNSPVGFESQYMRQVFAQALKREYLWNWREYPNPIETDEIYSTMKGGITV